MANRIATCDAINPAPPVMRTFFASYGSLACWVSAVIFPAVSPSPFAFPAAGGRAVNIYIFAIGAREGVAQRVAVIDRFEIDPRSPVTDD